MLLGTSTTCIIEPSYSRDSSVQQICNFPPSIRPSGQSSVLKQRLKNRSISTDIDLPPFDIEDNTLTADEKTSVMISPMQAYRLALDALESFEDAWSAYVEEEARYSSAFDEEDDE